MTGDFTMHGITKTISLDVKYNGRVETGRGPKIGFAVTGAINRLDFGVGTAGVLDGGGLILSEEVEVDIKVSMVQPKQ